MTRFEQELSGALGAFWNSNGNYIPADCAEILSHTDFPFSIEETAKARKAQTAAQLEAYRQNHRTSAEEVEEMRAAFGTGTTVVDIITGERIRL